MRALSKEDVSKILAATKNQVERDVIEFYLNTGCRKGEIVNVKVGHIDFERNEIFIDSTKTKCSKRTMPIFPNLMPILKRNAENKSADDKLFKHTVNTICDFYMRIKKEVKIEFTLKDFRHTASTNCKDSGIPLTVYHKWFGWHDDTRARRVYNHRTEQDNIISQEWAKQFNTCH